MLLLTDKTQLKAKAFIGYLKMAYGAWFALMFPHLDGYDLPFEMEFFFIEHYLIGFVGPTALMIFGRYGFVKDDIMTHVAF